jgi:hypothetical protein
MWIQKVTVGKLAVRANRDLITVSANRTPSSQMEVH